MPRKAAGEGSVGRRKDGTYYKTVQMSNERVWFYGRTRKEVVDKFEAWKKQHDQGVDVKAGKVKVSDFLDRWLTDVVKHRNKPRTFASYKQIVNEHISPRIGSILLTSLKPDHVQRLVNDLVANNRAPRTVRNVRAVLRQALNQAMRWRYVPYNAAALVELPRIEKYEVKPWTRDQVRKLLNHIKGHRLESLYVMTLMLGLREGEVLGLLVSNVSFEAGTIRVDGALQWHAGKLERQTTKTQSSIRTLPLPSMLNPLLAAHLKSQQTRFPDNPYMFASEVGTPINPRNLIRQFKALLKRAELPEIRFHDLRHFCAMFLASSGAHPRTIMEILGHSQISTTLNIYGHVLRETQVTAVDQVSRLLGEE